MEVALYYVHVGFSVRPLSSVVAPLPTLFRRRQAHVAIPHKPALLPAIRKCDVELQVLGSVHVIPKLNNLSDGDRPVAGRLSAGAESHANLIANPQGPKHRRVTAQRCSAASTRIRFLIALSRTRRTCRSRSAARLAVRAR